jgi:hypothetical protein
MPTQLNEEEIVNVMANELMARVHLDNRHKARQWLQREIRSAKSRGESLESVQKRYEELLSQTGDSITIVTFGSEKVMLDKSDAAVLRSECEVLIKRAASGACFIATACYGAADHPKVLDMRAFRDNYLLGCSTGRSFVRFYYAVSPPLARFLDRHHGIARATRSLVLEPLWRLLCAPRGKDR